MHDCVQIRSKINCMLAIPCLLRPDDMQPFVSGCFSGPGKMVSSRKNTPPVSKYVAPAALDPNRATEMPDELAGAMPMPVFSGGMIQQFVLRGRRHGEGKGGPTIDCWLSGAARRAANWTAPTSHFAMPLTQYKTKGGS